MAGTAIIAGLGAVSARPARIDFHALIESSDRPAAGRGRPDQIVAGRFSGLQRSVKTLRFGGRRARKGGTITASAILLDSEFDRT